MLSSKISILRCYLNRNIVIKQLPFKRVLSCLRQKDIVTSNRNLSISNVFRKITGIKTPNFPESITEGDIRWSTNIGDQVKTDDVIGEIETDKTSLSIVSPYTGVIKELLVADGGKVTKGQIVCNIDQDASVVETPIRIESKKTVEKVETKTETVKKQEWASISSKKSTEPILMSALSERIETKVPMSRMRQTIASRLKEAQNTNAMLTTFNEIDMTSAIEIRNRYKDKFLKEHGIKLGFMSAFINATVFALKAQPIVNSVIINNEIIYRNYIDISVAVSSPKGLVVPILRNAQLMNIIQMEKNVADLAEKAKKNQLAIEDMEGGTFTITNGGVFGSMMSTPIINTPQSAILGMHATKDRPVAINGKVEIRPIMYVALTYDHRLIDGREAVTFLRRIKDYIEDPSAIILGF